MTQTPDMRTIQDYEQGRREPSLTAAVRLVKALGVEVGELAPPLPKKKRGNK